MIYLELVENDIVVASLWALMVPRVGEEIVIAGTKSNFDYKVLHVSHLIDKNGRPELGCDHKVGLTVEKIYK